MKAITILSTMLLVTVLVAGCSDQKAPSALSGGSEDILAKGPPANSGMIVMRSETFFAVFYPDPESGMSITHGVDNIEFCNGIIDFDLVKLQEINVPEDANRLIDLIHGDEVTTSVWPFTNFDCNLFTTTDPLATGKVDLINTDNDLLVFLNPDNKNANAFGVMAHGKLTRPNGEEANLSAHCRAVWDGNDLSTLKFQDKINLK